MVSKMNLTILFLLILFSIVNAFPQRNLKLQNRAGPTQPKPRTYERNCRYGPVWGNFQKTCLTPGTQLITNRPFVVKKQEG